MTLLMSGTTRLSWLMSLPRDPLTPLRDPLELCILLHPPVHRPLTLMGTATLLVNQLVVDHLAYLHLLVHQPALPVDLELLVDQPLPLLSLLGLWTPVMPDMGALLPDQPLLVNQVPVALPQNLWWTTAGRPVILDGVHP